MLDPSRRMGTRYKHKNVRDVRVRLGGPALFRSVEQMKRTLLLILLCFPFLAPVGALSEPVVIRNGYVVPVANWAPLLEAKKGLARHWGRSYVMESVRFQGTPGMITALANGQLELAIL